MSRDHFFGFAIVAIIFYIVGSQWPNYGNMVSAKLRGIIPGA